MFQVRSEIGRGLAQDFLEHAIEVRERLKADFVGDFAYPKVWIEQQVFRILDPRA